MPDREELFKLWLRYGSSFESDSSEGYELADAILASDWLAAHDAEIREAALKEAEEAVQGAFPPAADMYSQDPGMSAWVEGGRDAWDAIHALRTGMEGSTR
jgi:hypothetical protein